MTLPAQQYCQINKMYTLEKKDAEVMLLKLLNRTLKRNSDIDELMDLAIKNEYSIPMKEIRHRFDAMEKNKLTPRDIDNLDTLMHFFGP